jgi:hypothetical protein
MRHCKEPLGSDEAKSPLGLTIEVATKCVLGSPSLISRMNASHSPASVVRRPLTILVGHVPTLDLNDGHAALGRQQHEIDLDVAGLAIAETEAVDEDLTFPQ